VPGVAVGLARTEVGGKVMLVEVSKAVGTGRLRITG
jgi:ATP-dependent Lon protease